MKTSLSRTALAAWAAALVLVVIACAVNPATGKRQIMLVSEAQEVEMGRQADQEATAAFGLYPDPKVQDYISQLGKRMAAQTERPNLPWSFKVVDDPAVNAFALPGGFIYITRGIMAHLRSEAELMGVMGHEIGHVTGRHSASAISRQQLAMGGLVLGMIVRPELQRFGGLAQQGLGILFLKFGRDQEIQADDLGLRYMTKQAYDPKEMVEVFKVLDRVSGGEEGGNRLPDWLSTHPSPGNRAENIQKEIDSTGAKGEVVRRTEFVRYLDGMTFGENPREGFFQQTAFYHPELRFRMVFPTGFRTQNQRQAVIGVSQQQDAVVALTLVQGSTPEQAAQAFFSQQGLEVGRGGRDNVNGLPAYTGFFQATIEQGTLRGEASFIQYDGKIFRILGYTPAERFGTYQSAIDGTIRSFARLTDQRFINVEPKRLQVVNLNRDMALGDFAQAYPSTVKLQTVGLINGVVGNQLIEDGPAKRVVGGRLPGE